jgi:hypothetical protein
MAIEWELFDHATGKRLGTIYAADQDDLTRMVQSRYGDRAVQANPVTSKRGQFGLGAVQDTMSALGGIMDLGQMAHTGGVPPRHPVGPAMTSAGEKLAAMLGINPVPPQTTGQGYARAGGRAAGQLPIVAATGGMATPGLAAANTAGAFAGEFAGEAAKNVGLGGFGQAAASTAADLLATKGTGSLLRRAGASGLGPPPGAFVPSRMQQKVFTKLAPLDILDAKSKELLGVITERYGILDDAKNAAWQAVPKTGVASVDGAGLVAAARKIIKDEIGDSADLAAVAPPGLVKSLARRVGKDGAPLPVTFENLRMIDRHITKLVREAGAQGATEAQRQQAAMARKLADAVDETMGEMSRTADGAAVSALDRARAASKTLSTQFDRQDAIYQKAIDPRSLLEDPHRSVEAIVKSRHGNTLSKTLTEIAGTTPAGKRALRGAFVDISAGEAEKSFSASRTLKFLDEHEAVGRNMMGDASYDHYRGVISDLTDVSNKYRKTFAHRLSLYAGYGVAGALATGSRTAGAVGGAAVGSVLESLGQRLNADEMTRVARRALIDRDLFELMKSAPTKANVARADLWAQALIVRGAMRTGESQ